MHLETTLQEAELIADADIERRTRENFAHLKAGVTPFRPEHSGLEMPTWIWATMGISYAAFFVAIFLATGIGAAAIFAIAISILYTLMYFGTASVLFNLDGRSVRPFTASRDGMLQTLTGSMSHGAVAAQILAVPVMISLFAIAVAIIRAIEM